MLDMTQALELRCDRVANILAKSIYQQDDEEHHHHHHPRPPLSGTPNLCILAGDARAALARVAAASVHEAHVNYPQPPGRGAGGADHLLTPPFLRLLLRALRARGTLTILTDNRAYAEDLARAVAAAAAGEGESALVSRPPPGGRDAGVAVHLSVPVPTRACARDGQRPRRARRGCGEARKGKLLVAPVYLK